MTAAANDKTMISFIAAVRLWMFCLLAAGSSWQLFNDGKLPATGLAAAQPQFGTTVRSAHGVLFAGEVGLPDVTVSRHSIVSALVSSQAYYCC
jgi:hypothetical protein